LCIFREFSVDYWAVDYYIVVCSEKERVQGSNGCVRSAEF
jgi:hypothetical protein